MAKPTVAILGASNDRSKYGNKSVRAHLRAGYTVYPIHPTELEIEGQPAFPSLEAVPGSVDRVSFYVPPQIGVTMLEQVAAKRPREIFLNPGSESQALLEMAAALGLQPILACSIVELGRTPAAFP